MSASEGNTVGRRLKNNPRVCTKGLVEEHFCLDLRTLLREGIIAKDQVTTWEPTTEFPFRLVANLECPHTPFMRADYNGVGQKLDLVYQTDRRNRRRLLFRNGNGCHTEKIYFVDGKFVSRHDGKLKFKAQFVCKKDLFDQRDELESALSDRGTEQEPLPSERLDIQKALAEVKKEMDDEGLDFIARFMERRNQRKERRRRFLRRIRAADVAMNQRISASPDWIIRRFRGLVDDLKLRALQAGADPRTMAPFNPSYEKPEDLDHQPHLHTGILGRLGVLKAGHLTARQIGWPIKWLPQRRRRLHLLVDMRDAENPCVVIVSQTVKKAKGTLFWLKPSYGYFNRKRFDFKCPTTGETSTTLVYRDGKIQLIQVTTRETLHSAEVRLRQLRRTVLPDAPISDEHVALIKECLLNNKAEIKACMNGTWFPLLVDFTDFQPDILLRRD